MRPIRRGEQITAQWLNSTAFAGPCRSGDFNYFRGIVESSTQVNIGGRIETVEFQNGIIPSVGDEVFLLWDGQRFVPIPPLRLDNPFIGTRTFWNDCSCTGTAPVVGTRAPTTWKFSRYLAETWKLSMNSAPNVWAAYPHLLPATYPDNTFLTWDSPNSWYSEEFSDGYYWTLQEDATYGFVLTLSNPTADPYDEPEFWVFVPKYPHAPLPDRINDLIFVDRLSTGRSPVCNVCLIPGGTESLVGLSENVNIIVPTQITLGVSPNTIAALWTQPQGDFSPPIQSAAVSVEDHSFGEVTGPLFSGWGEWEQQPDPPDVYDPSSETEWRFYNETIQRDNVLLNVGVKFLWGYRLVGRVANVYSVLRARLAWGVDPYDGNADPLLGLNYGPDLQRVNTPFGYKWQSGRYWHELQYSQNLSFTYGLPYIDAPVDVDARSAFEFTRYVGPLIVSSSIG